MHQQLSVMSRASTSAYNLGTISSPLSLYYQEESNILEEGTGTHQKGVGVARHNVSVITLSGRPLPSKWDDAERWICSPVSGNPGPGEQTLLQKSKSGPIQLSNDGTNNFMVSDSPFSTGVLVPPPGVSLYYNYNNRGRVSKSTRWTDLASDSSSLEEEEEEEQVDRIKARETIISRKDVATQMSPDRWSLRGTNCSSPINSPPKLDIREVQVDNRATLISLADKNETLSYNRPYLDRQEAKIAAWESLHKAKAEASIRKLEMKLEKKRASAMDAIVNKLAAAQMKAENMRKSTSTISKENQRSKTYYHKVKFFLSGCVTCCHAGT